MAYEIEGINPSHSFGDEITFNVFHWPPIVDKVPDWLSNDGQGLQHQDAVELGRLLLASLLYGHFERVSASFNEEDYLVQPDLLGNAISKTNFAKRDGLKPAGSFALNRDYLTQFSLFLGVCGGFRIR